MHVSVMYCVIKEAKANMILSRARSNYMEGKKKIDALRNYVHLAFNVQVKLIPSVKFHFSFMTFNLTKKLFNSATSKKYALFVKRYIFF